MTSAYPNTCRKAPRPSCERESGRWGLQLTGCSPCPFPALSKLTRWEDRFEKDMERIRPNDRARAGALLPVVPSPHDWSNFLEAVEAEWPTWLRGLGEKPHCLIVLYGGLAFYEYEEGRFWPQFQAALGGTTIPPSRQTEINETFVSAADRLGFRIIRHETWTESVGSAVYQIGIPLSLWDGFLDICEWALWRPDWKCLAPLEWSEAVSRRAGGRRRLATFLRESREVTAERIQEMLDARRWLTEDKSLTIDDIKQACFLRPEYFDYVPETADFLRPTNPASLLAHRPRVVWNAERWRLSLHVPGVAALPSTWQIASVVEQAAATAHEIPLNSAAFRPVLEVRLEEPNGFRREWELPGLAPCGLFDLEDGRAVNLKREQLPVRAYDLLSLEPLGSVERTGFDEQEHPVNDPCQLEDGTTCYRTRLLPNDRFARLSFAERGVTRELWFRDRARIEAFVYAGAGHRAANFRWFDGFMKVDHLPLISLGIPFGYFGDTDVALQRQIGVFVDGNSVGGRWQKSHDDEHRQFYFWHWGPDVLGQPKCDGRPGTERTPFRGKRTLTVKAPELGICVTERQLELENPKPGMDECWSSLPGGFLPWFVLCQRPQGMRRCDIAHAENAIAPGQQVRYDLLRRYATVGLLKQEGHTWGIAESRAVLSRLSGGECEMRFCGNPCTLWGLFRLMYDRHRTLRLPAIAVVKNKGELPFLSMRWEGEFEPDLRHYLDTHSVRIVPNLWKEPSK